MDFEFPEISEKEREVIRSYFAIQTNFIAGKGFFINDRNFLIRSNAVSAIAQCYKMISRTVQPDAFIPYLAMNYFDRYISRNGMKLKDVKLSTPTDKVRLIAMACLTISAKLRNKHFSVEQFLKDMKIRKLTTQMILQMEIRILHVLKWEIQSLTAFTFLNYYYPYFKQFGRLNRRSIYEILVQAQGENTFIHYNPSMVAFSAFLAASKLAYPEKYNDIATPYALSKIGSKEQVEQCAQYMVDLCIKMKIKIETPESGTGSRSTSSNVAAVPKQSRGKAAVVVHSSEEDEGEETSLIHRKRDKGKMLETSKVQVPVQVEELSDSDEEDEGEKTSLIHRKRDKGKIPETSKVKVQVPWQVEELSDSDDEVTEVTEEEKRRLAKGKGEAVDVTETFTDDKARVEAIIPQALVKGKGEEVDVTETFVDDKARIEAIIRRALFKGKAEVGEEEPQGSISEIVELVAPKELMNFKLKWLTDVPLVDIIIERKPQPSPPTTVGIRLGSGEREKVVTCGCNII